MKKALLIFLLMPIVTIAQKPAFTIDITINNFNRAARAFITNGGNGKVMDSSALSRNGKFLLNGFLDKKEPVVGSLYVKTEADMMRINFKQVYICPGLVTIHCDAGEDNKKGGVDIENLKITDEYSLHSDRAAFEKMMNDLGAKQKLVMDKYTAAKEAKNATEMASLQAEMNGFGDQFVQAGQNWIKEHPDHFFSGFLLTEGFNPADTGMINTALSLVKMLSPEMQKTAMIKSIQKRMDQYKALSIGGIPQNLKANDASGKAVSVADYRGKYLYLIISSTKKNSSVNDYKDIEEKYKKYKSKNFEVLEFSAEESKEEWQKAVQDRGAPWVHIAEFNSPSTTGKDWYWGSENLQLYRPSENEGIAIPGFYLFDPEGKLMGKYIKGERLNKKLHEIFGF